MLLPCYVKAAVLEKKTACNNLLHFAEQDENGIICNELENICNITNSNI
jgi:hypothetical protein